MSVAEVRLNDDRCMVIPDKMSLEKIYHLKAMGVEVVITRSDVGKGHPEYYQDRFQDPVSAAMVTRLEVMEPDAGSPSLSRWVMGMGILLTSNVGIPRIYLQVHYPSDVLAACLLSVLWVMGLHIFLKGLIGSRL